MIKIYKKKKEIPAIALQKLILLSVSYQRIYHSTNFKPGTNHLTKFCSFIETSNGACEIALQTSEGIEWKIV